MSFDGSKRSATGVKEAMPLAQTRLEVLQVRKLSQCVRDQDSDQVSKLISMGIPDLVNYQGSPTAHAHTHTHTHEKHVRTYTE